MSLAEFKEEITECEKIAGLPVGNSKTPLISIVAGVNIPQTRRLLVTK
jgi:hypothetical protein